MTGIMQRGDVEVVPGLSIGEVALGLSRSEVLSVLGTPAHIEESPSQGSERVLWRYRHGLYELAFEMPLDRLVEVTSRHRLVAVDGQRLFGASALPADALLARRDAWERGGLRLLMGPRGVDGVCVFEVEHAVTESAAG